LVECSQCNALRTGGEACPHCGFLLKRRPDAIIFAEGELARIDKSGRPIESSDPHERMRWHAMLAHIAGERRYKSGWVSHKYKERFGTWPPVSRPIPPMRPSLEVLSWVRSRNIAFAKAREKAGAA
jgi:DNA repair protein RadD